MLLYLMQHGKAMSKEEHPDRPLTEEGQRDVERVAAWIVRLHPEISEIRHSGKARAEETAAIIARHLKLEQCVIRGDGLKPNDDVRILADTLPEQQNSLMLVGHLPFLSRLASYLLVGEPERTLIRFQMGGIVCLTRQDEGWGVSWMITPDTV